jgi:hypothetical protein
MGKERFMGWIFGKEINFIISYNFSERAAILSRSLAPNSKSLKLFFRSLLTLRQNKLECLSTTTKAQ